MYLCIHVGFLQVVYYINKFRQRQNITVNDEHTNVYSKQNFVHLFFFFNMFSIYPVYWIYFYRGLRLFRENIRIVGSENIKSFIFEYVGCCYSWLGMFKVICAIGSKVNTLRYSDVPSVLTLILTLSPLRTASASQTVKNTNLCNFSYHIHFFLIIKYILINKKKDKKSQF